jgi:hypothetical protein
MMDRVEAARLLRQEMTRYARRAHAELARLIDEIDAYEVEGADGVRYQVEVEAHWVEAPGGPIQVLAGIDDGSFRGAFRSVTDGFVKGLDATDEMARAVGD